MMQQSKLLIYLEEEVRQLQAAVWVQYGLLSLNQRPYDTGVPIPQHTHQTLLSADVFQFNLSVLQLLSEGLLNALGLQEPGLSVFQLGGETDC